MALYTAPFGKRIVALALDGAVVAVALAIAVHGVNAFASQWSAVWLDPFWEEKVPTNVAAERVGAPSVVKEESGNERSTQYSRETRIYPDGAVRIFTVIEANVKKPDGSVEQGRAENLIGESRDSYWRTRATYVLAGFIAFVYFGAFESSVRQATPGKSLLGLRVTDLKGKRLAAWRAWFRQAAKLATCATSGFGYLTALFTQRAQTIHDVIAGTLVVTGRSEAVSS
jgi:uncharacterized RDD family membrane protein YckC